MPWRLRDPTYTARSLGELTGVVRGLSVKVDAVEQELRALERTLGEMATQDRIEAGVRDGLRKAETRGWTWRERWIGVGAFTLLVVNTAQGFFFHH